MNTLGRTQWVLAAVWLTGVLCLRAGAAEPEGQYASPEEAARILGERLAGLREQGLRADAAEEELFKLRHDLGWGQTEFWGHRVWRIEQQLKRGAPEEKVTLKERAPMPRSPFGFAAPKRDEIESGKAGQLPALAASLGLQAVQVVEPFFDPSNAASAPEAWRRLDQELGAWSAAGLEPILVLDSGPKAPANEAGWGAFRRWAAGLAERYDGDGKEDSPAGVRVNAFQVQYEVDSAVDLGAPFGDSPEAYAAMVRAAAENIRLAAAGAKIVLGSMRSIGDKLRSPWYFDQVLGYQFEDGDKITKYFDVAAVAHDPSLTACKTLNVSLYDCLGMQVVRMRKTLDAAGSAAPVWVVVNRLPETREEGGAGSGPKEVALLAMGGLIQGAERVYFRGLAPAAPAASGAPRPAPTPLLFDLDLRPTAAGWALKDIATRLRPAEQIWHVSLGAPDEFMFQALIGQQDLYLAWSAGREDNVTIAHRVHQPKVQGVALADGPPGAPPAEIEAPSHAVQLGPRPLWLTAPGQTKRN